MTELRQSSGTIRKRHSQRQRKRIRMMKIRRTIFFSVIAFIIIFIVMFFTPLFNIRGVDISGNEKVESSAIMECVGETEGKNLFRTKNKAIKKELLKNPYIQNVTIDRIILKSRLSITVTECREAAAIAGGAGYIIIDTDAKVLAEAIEKPTSIPEVTGLSVTNISVGEKLKIEEQDKFDIMLMCLEEMEKIEILNGVTTLSVTDVGNITFNYEDRLDAICGSSVDLAKKLRYFKSGINSSRLTENARGTIDLTTTGKVIYSP